MTMNFGRCDECGLYALSDKFLGNVNYANYDEISNKYRVCVVFNNHTPTCCRWFYVFYAIGYIFIVRILSLQLEQTFIALLCVSADPSHIKGCVTFYFIVRYVILMFSFVVNVFCFESLSLAFAVKVKVSKINRIESNRIAKMIEDGRGE